MLVLQDINDKLEVVLAGAHATNALPVVCSWRDITTTGYTPGRSNINTNGSTSIDAVAAPAASTFRVIDHVSIYNADTAAAVVTVRIDDNGTEYTLVKVTLAVGERLEFAEGEGWTVLDINGAVKNINTTTGMTTVVLGSDVTNNNASANTIADVTGLSFPVVAGSKYYFKFTIIFTSAATTTGSRWSINGPAITLLAYMSRYGITATTETVNHAVAYDIPAAANATSVATTGNIAVIEGILVPSANGTLIARFASEVSSSAIVAKAGSIVQYQQVA